ncbi:MAG: M23 family metallopeptidase [Desulfosporosinus sp.]|jgi:murein DD-endopeptidase MepM/ murein hydrolase activator NlpD
MKRRELLAGRALLCCFCLLLGSIILYQGYPDNISFLSREKTLKMPNATEQATSVSTVHAPESRYTASRDTALKMPSPREEKTAEQGTVSNSSHMNQVINPPSQSLKDFPCPVQGIPLRGIGNYYSEKHGGYIFHAGVDYAEPEGTVIRATHGGKVIFSGADPFFGQKVTLDCGNGWQVTYGGLINLRVQVGDTAEYLDALGQVGLFNAVEGESEQPQLHYEIWHDGEVQGL